MVLAEGTEGPGVTSAEYDCQRPGLLTGVWPLCVGPLRVGVSEFWACRPQLSTHPMRGLCIILKNKGHQGILPPLF